MRRAYRSDSLPTGCFDTVEGEESHIHFDSGRGSRESIKVVRALEAIGNPGEVYSVHASIAGPEREKLKDVYAVHTPGVIGKKEEFDTFTSTLIYSRENGLALLPYFQKGFHGRPDVVMEWEQPVAWLDQRGLKIRPRNEYMKRLSDKEAGMKLDLSQKYETHNMFSVKKKDMEEELLPLLYVYCVKHRIPFGGWFKFDDGDHWGYSSNSFSNGDYFLSRMQKEHELLLKFMESIKIPYNLETLVELIVGIKHGF